MGEGVAFAMGPRPPMIPPGGDKRLDFNEIGKKIRPPMIPPGGDKILYFK